MWTQDVDPPDPSSDSDLDGDHDVGNHGVTPNHADDANNSDDAHPITDPNHPTAPHTRLVVDNPQHTTQSKSAAPAPNIDTIESDSSDDSSTTSVASAASMPHPTPTIQPSFHPNPQHTSPPVTLDDIVTDITVPHRQTTELTRNTVAALAAPNTRLVDARLPKRLKVADHSVTASTPAGLLPQPTTRARRRADGRADRAALNALYDQTLKSDSRLFFIRHHLSPGSHPTWHLVRIDLDATNPQLAKTMGTYVANWYLPHHQDCHRHPLTHCRFWPDVRAKETNAQLVISPGKINQLVQRKNSTAYWFTTTVNLATDRLVGPMNFIRHPPSSSNRQHSKYSHLIDLSDWDQLQVVGRLRGIDVEEIDSHPTQITA